MSHRGARGVGIAGCLRRARLALALLAVCGCSRRPAAPAEAQAAAWPDSWRIDFAFRCTATGEDVRFCACLAEEVQRRWTPAQLQALGPDGMEPAVRACRERMAEAR